MVSDTVRNLFPQLLANGYVPLPNKDKRCMLPRWNSVLVDAVQCRRWTRQSRWQAIGLRVEPPLLVLDIDTPDPVIAAAIRGIMPHEVLAGALERIGSPPKTAFFLRLAAGEEPFHELHTCRFHFDGAAKPAFAVQAFGGGGGAHQFGAFGPHSVDDATGAVLKTYSWVDDRSPANVRLDALPALTREDVFNVLDAADAILRTWPGMVIDASTHHGESFQQEAVLDDGMIFTDAEGVDYTYGELVAEAKARHELRQAPLRITGSFTRDPASSGSPRCKVHWSRRNGISIVDFKTHVTYRLIRNADDPELDRAFQEIFRIAGRS